MTAPLVPPEPTHRAPMEGGTASVPLGTGADFSKEYR